MNKILYFFVLLFLPLAWFYGQTITLKTNGLDVGSIPLKELNNHEIDSLYASVSNELRLMQSYLKLTKTAGSDTMFSAIIESKRFHLQLIEHLIDKHRLPNIVHKIDVSQNEPEDKTVKEACKLKVKEELENKMFYEKHLMQVKSPDVKAVFTLIAENSEKTFKLIQSYILKK